MSLSKFSRGYREFMPSSAVPELITRSKNYQREDVSATEPLLIFKTSNQQTWLVATGRRLYVILDDVRKPEPSIIRSVPKKRLVDDAGGLTLRLGERARSERTGLLDMQGYKALLFSHRLFSEERVSERVEQLLTDAMG